MFSVSKPRRTSSPVTTFLPVMLLRVADRFGDDHGVHHAAIVEVLADLILLGLALALVDDVLDDVLDRRIVRADLMQVER